MKFSQHNDQFNHHPEQRQIDKILKIAALQNEDDLRREKDYHKFVT